MPLTRTSGQGRKKGVPNKRTAEIKALAQEYGAPAIARLAQLSGLVEGMPGAESDAAQIAAIRELLDRGYGKAAQPISGDPDGAPLAIDFRWADATPREEEVIEANGASSLVLTFANDGER
jgi:hypothetical protein